MDCGNTCVAVYPFTFFVELLFSFVYKNHFVIKVNLTMYFTNVRQKFKNYKKIKAIEAVIQLKK